MKCLPDLQAIFAIVHRSDARMYEPTVSMDVVAGKGGQQPRSSTEYSTPVLDS